MNYTLRRGFLSILHGQWKFFLPYTVAFRMLRCLYWVDHENYAACLQVFKIWNCRLVWFARYYSVKSNNERKFNGVISISICLHSSFVLRLFFLVSKLTSFFSVFTAISLHSFSSLHFLVDFAAMWWKSCVWLWKLSARHFKAGNGSRGCIPMYLLNLFRYHCSCFNNKDRLRNNRRLLLEKLVSSNLIIQSKACIAISFNLATINFFIWRRLSD